jgi:hypothetical protein
MTMRKIRHWLEIGAVVAFALLCLAFGGSDPAYAQQAGAFKASSSVLSTNLVAVTGSHKLQSFEVSADSTLSGAAWWILIYDASADPGNGTVAPAKCYAMSSGTTSFSAGFVPGGVNFQNGIVMVVSTTGCFTETQSTHAFLSADWQ